MSHCRERRSYARLLNESIRLFIPSIVFTFYTTKDIVCINREILKHFIPEDILPMCSIKTISYNSKLYFQVCAG